MRPDDTPDTPSNDSQITLRDYFAAHALTGILAMSNRLAPNSLTAAIAYAHADAMLAARE